MAIVEFPKGSRFVVSALPAGHLFEMNVSSGWELCVRSGVGATSIVTGDCFSEEQIVNAETRPFSSCATIKNGVANGR